MLPTKGEEMYKREVFRHLPALTGYILLQLLTEELFYVDSNGFVSHDGSTQEGKAPNKQLLSAEQNQFPFIWDFILGESLVKELCALKRCWQRVSLQCAC